jgi:hypothetical protein
MERRILCDFIEYPLKLQFYSKIIHVRLQASEQVQSQLYGGCQKHPKVDSGYPS